jgi:hypothetical protein
LNYKPGGNLNMLIRILSIVAGSGLGWLYYHFVGCMNGSCPIASNPWASMIFGGAFLGLFLPDLLKKKKDKAKSSDQS